MKRNLKKSPILGFTVASILCLGGCANPQMMDAKMDEKMEMMKVEMMMEVDKAMRKANTADYNAGVAKSMADDAMSKTDMMHQMMMDKGMKMKMMK